jgi:hypothetical protein
MEGRSLREAALRLQEMAGAIEPTGRSRLPQATGYEKK